MSDPINIEITDGIASSIEPKLEGIAAAADAGAEALAVLQGETSGLATNILQSASASSALAGGLQSVSISAKDFAAALAASGNDLRAITPSMVGIAESSEVAAASLRGYTVAQVELFRAQQEGANFAADLAASFALTGKSAKDSAAAFIAEAAAAETANAALRGYTSAELDLLRAQQDGLTFLNALNESFGLNAKAVNSARESAAAMSAALDAEDAAFAAVAVSLAEHNAQIVTANTLVQEFRGNLAATATTEAEVATTTGELKTSLSSLGGFIIGAFAIGEVSKAADAYIGFQNSIKLAGLSANDTAIVMDRLRDTADKNGITISSVSTIYRRLALEQDRLHASTGDLLKFIDTVTDAFRINGTSAAASQRVIYDLSEALSGNTVQWRNIRQIIQQAPEILQLAANGIQGMNGDVNKLTDSLKGSKFSTEVFFKGLVDGYKEADVEAAKTTLTISGTVNVLVNAFDLFVGKSGEASGAIQFVNTAILLVAHNLPLIADGVIAFGAAWLVIKGYNIASDLLSIGRTLVTVTIPAMWTFATETVPAAIIGVASLARTILTEGVPAFIAMSAGLIEPTLIILGIAAALVTVGVAVLAATGHLDLIDTTIKAVTDGFGGALKAVSTTAANFLGLNQNSAAAGSELDNIRAKLHDYTTESAKTNTALAQTGTATAATTSAYVQYTGALTDAANENEFYNQQVQQSITLADGATKQITTYQHAIDGLSSSLQRASVAAASLYDTVSKDVSGNGPDIVGLPKQSSFPDITTVPAPKFATGGSFMVGGSGATDTSQVKFWATKGERVDVLTPAQQRQQAANYNAPQAANVTVNIYPKDYDSFRNSRAQVARQLGSAISVGMSNG